MLFRSGVPVDGLDREISEVGVTEIRTARRMGELVRSNLDTSIEEYPTLLGLLTAAVAVPA